MFIYQIRKRKNPCCCDWSTFEWVVKFVSNLSCSFRIQQGLVVPDPLRCIFNDRSFLSLAEYIGHSYGDGSNDHLASKLSSCIYRHGINLDKSFVLPVFYSKDRNLTACGEAVGILTVTFVFK